MPTIIGQAIVGIAAALGLAIVPAAAADSTPASATAVTSAPLAHEYRLEHQEAILSAIANGHYAHGFGFYYGDQRVNDALNAVYQVQLDTNLPCDGYASILMRTGDYQGSDSAMGTCLGAEDSAAVDLILWSAGR